MAKIVTVGATALFACAAVLASSVISASAMVRIGEDRGGQIGHYLNPSRSFAPRASVSSSMAIACRLAR